LTPRLLVLDSSPEIGHQIARVSQRAGYQAHVCADYRDFHRRYDSETSVVVIDLMLQNPDGVEIIRALSGRKSPAGLLLTSKFDPRVLGAAERLARAQGLWVIGTMTKPFSDSVLETLLSDVEEAAVERTMQFKAFPTLDDLREGIERDELRVYYQPKINLNTLTVHSVEALVRWQHPGLGLLSPDRFIEMSEEGGMINAVTYAVMEKSFMQCADWLTGGLNLKVSINVSTRSLNDLDLPDRIVELAGRHNIAPDQVVLEITESWLGNDQVAALDILTRLRIKGFELSIDDYGTGYSTMQQLKEIPFSELKLDRSFVSGSSKNPDARAIVESSIRLGHELNLHVVAEGVASQEDWDLVCSLDCDEGQGFFIARPMPGSDMPDWLDRWQASLGEKVRLS
jgi:EAL domain-containing protein (putative c-di-GMP-specific phosphodiesterase class I)/ActR/RegA family two-component response regulator